MADQETAVAGEPGDRHVRRGDGINITRAEVMAGLAAYSERDQADLLWLHGYVTDELGGSRTRICEALNVTWSTLWKTWMGKYEAAIENTMKAVRIFRRKCESSKRRRFIETIVTRKIWAVCDVALQRAAMVMISGPTGRSKTWGIDEWRHRNNHGRAVYAYCRKNGGFRALLEAVGTALGISERRNTAELKAAIEHSLDSRNVLVLDEFAHLYPIGRRASIDAIEWVRELHDVTGCGVVLCATEGFEAFLKSGPYAQWFDQLMGRIELHLRIPRQFSRQEVAELLAAYVDEPDPDLVAAARKIANSSTRGCRDLFRNLDRAAQVAASLGKPLTPELLNQTVAAVAEALDIPKE